MLMLSRPSLGGVEGEGQFQRVQHGGGNIARFIPPLSLLLLPLIRYREMIDVKALWYGPQPIDPLISMVLGRRLQERAGTMEGRLVLIDNSAAASSSLPLLFVWPVSPSLSSRDRRSPRVRDASLPSRTRISNNVSFR